MAAFRHRTMIGPGVLNFSVEFTVISLWLKHRLYNPSREMERLITFDHVTRTKSLLFKYYFNNKTNRYSSCSYWWPRFLPFAICHRPFCTVILNSNFAIFKPEIVFHSKIIILAFSFVKKRRRVFALLKASSWESNLWVTLSDFALKTQNCEGKSVFN